MPPKRKASVRGVIVPGTGTEKTNASAASSSLSPSTTNKKAKASAAKTFSFSSSDKNAKPSPSATSAFSSSAFTRKPKVTNATRKMTTTAATTGAKGAPKRKSPQLPPSSSAAATSATLKQETNEGPPSSNNISSSTSSTSSSGPRYFLMKSEPHEFSVDDLAGLSGQTHCWEGVRNYQARNIMRDQMRVGDKAFFYHSSCKVPGIVGLVEITKKAYPDYFQWDKKSKYFDEKSTKEAPRWWMVDVTLREKLEEMVTLEGLKEEGLKKGSPLAAMALLQKGSRLSVQPVREEEWHFICETMITKQGGHEGKNGGGLVKKEEGKGAGDE